MKTYLRYIGMVLMSFCWEQSLFAAVQFPEEDIHKLLMKYMYDSGEPTVNEQQLYTGDSKTLLEALVMYEFDTSAEIRRKAYVLAWKIGERSYAPDIRKMAVEQLVNAFSDSDLQLSYGVSKLLLSFVSEDFTEQSKTVLRHRLESVPLQGTIILVIGVANLQEVIPDLKQLRSSSTDYEAVSPPNMWFSLNGWYARLALARMGSQEDIAHCIDMIESHPDADFRVTQLLKNLAYIRQPEAIMVLQEYLESDQRIDMGADVIRTPYYEFALTLLGQILEGFPIIREDQNYTLSDIETARAWMRAQTEFKIKR